MLATITADTCGRHDTIGGACAQESNVIRYGEHTRHQHACRQTFLQYGAPAGIGQRQLGPQHQFLHERSGHARRGSQFRGRPLRTGQIRRDRGGPRHSRADQQLPAAEQSLQRLESDTGQAVGLVGQMTLVAENAAGPLAEPALRPTGERPGTIEVLKPGIQTTVQDGAGRSGLWDVGVPPSGAFDDVSFSLAQLAVGNTADSAGLECVMAGPVLRFREATVVCVTGAATAATLDGALLAPGVPTAVTAGGVLEVGKLTGPGMRGYVAVQGGLDVPVVLGSRSTFVLGKFGGHSGRALRKGDVLGTGEPIGKAVDVARQLPALRSMWQLRVTIGPHGAPDHLSPAGFAQLFAADWTVDHRSDRTGVRLVGPVPGWARPDGGEAGLHPSNVHDSAYPVGGIMLSGDTPVIVGPDGPSLGGFVVPCVVISADRWILGQLRPGDSVSLSPVTLDVS